MLEKIKLCLTNNTYTDDLINLFIDDTTKEVKIYCNRENIDVELESIIRKIVICRFVDTVAKRGNYIFLSVL